MMTRHHYKASTVFLCLVLACSKPLPSAERAPLAPAQTNSVRRTFEPVTLRGYGTVSGVWRQEKDGTVLEITCEDADKAKLTQAKYLSDLQALPGVTVSEGKDFTRFAVEGQGSIAAWCQGSKVVILAAKSASNLALLVKEVKPEGVTTAQVKVPMWLDRWDKYNFRHYYRAWDVPEKETDATYDFIHEFDYAKQQDNAGFVFPVTPLVTDSADGMINTGFDAWAKEEATKRDLPIDMHLAAGAGSEPTWFLNRFREQTQLKMPGFTGNYHALMSPSLGGQGVLSWSATTAEDDRLSLLQKMVRQSMECSNVTSFLEPHGELYHGAQDIFLDYGPVVDANYRTYLREKYDAVEKVATRWGVTLKSWNDVHFPEIASFAGWGPRARDVAPEGATWRVGYEQLADKAADSNGSDNPQASPKSLPAPPEWFAADFNDAQWPEIPGAGHDHQLFLPRRPAVFRRAFDVPAAWKNQNPKVWLYVWDLNLATNADVILALNGKEVGRSKVAFSTPHWTAVDVTQELKAGKNTLAVRVPQGYLAYKTYLSPVEPRQYPNLGKERNAQWVDCSNFLAWARIKTVRRGMEMIRQVAPNPGITLMAPDAFADGIKTAAIDYGGEFRNTGYMGGFYADYLTSLMRGADLPFSVEPGGPAANLADFKNQLGLYQTEGIQAIDYFIHIGSILWRPEIKAEYEAQRKQIALMGQSHFAKAEVACFYSDQIARLTGYPWGTTDRNQNVGSGYWNWNPGSVLRGAFPYDGLSQSSFASGDADAYRVIIDSNTSVMDEGLVADIETWVRKGGTFITLAQTGRHTPEQPDAWPIARLTGYTVTGIDGIKPDGTVEQAGTLRPASGQKVFDTRWNNVRANGLHLKRAATDVQDLLLWNDGTVAAGVRPLGKGFVVQLGAKFTGNKIFDRVEPGSNRAEVKQLRSLLSALLEWRDIKREAGHLSPENDTVWLRPALTNNGLYNTWTVRNWSRNESQTVSLVLDKGDTSTFALDMRTGKKLSVQAASDGARIESIALGPLDTRVFLTPRGQITDAPQNWFDLQRKWWRGTKKPPTTPLPAPLQRWAKELTPDWKFQPLDAAQNAAPMLAAQFDDSNWTARPLGIWNVKEVGKGRGIFRKTFTVPSEWKEGLVSLWMTSWNLPPFVEKGRVWLDGKEVKPFNNGAYIAIGLPTLTADSKHTLAVEVESRGVLAGLRGQCWLSFEPTPAEKQDLSGQWQPSVDGLRFGDAIALPGKFNASFLKRNIVIDAKHRGQNVVLTLDGDRTLICVLINGKLVRRHHHMIGERGSLNLTPFIRFGQENEIELVRWGLPPISNAALPAVRDVFLAFYDPAVYP